MNLQTNDGSGAEKALFSGLYRRISDGLYKTWYSRRSIFWQLTLTYLTIILLLMALGVYMNLELNRLTRVTRSIEEVDAVIIRLTDDMLENVFSQVRFEKKFYVSSDPDFHHKFQEIRFYFNRDMDKLKPLMAGSTVETLFAEIRDLYDDYVLRYDRNYRASLSGQSDLLDNASSYQKDNLVDQINENLKKINKKARSDLSSKIDLTGQISDGFNRVFGISSIAAIIVGILISFLTTRSINQSITRLKDKTKEVAKGKFDKIADISGSTEIVELADDFNVMCDQLRELDEMKEDFVSHVSHELRTPLTVIKEASSMLLEKKNTGKKDDELELLAMITEECERLITSVNRILDLSCMEARKMQYHFSDCVLLPVLQKSILKLAPLAQSKQISLELKPLPILPRVTMDEERIGQVLENLISNALKFTPDNGDVIINAGQAGKRGEWIVISVRDSGRGMRKENLDKIFDKFQRITDGKETVLGTGLGLTISKHIINAHGGKIWAQSNFEKGSTFFFTLPVSSSA